MLLLFWTQAAMHAFRFSNFRFSASTSERRPSSCVCTFKFDAWADDAAACARSACCVICASIRSRFEGPAAEAAEIFAVGAAEILALLIRNTFGAAETAAKEGAAATVAKEGAAATAKLGAATVANEGAATANEGAATTGCTAIGTCTTGAVIGIIIGA